MGRSELRLRQEMIQQGGIHGNLFCLKNETVRQIIEIGFKLPLGIYRTDATLGAVLFFNLDPKNNDWDPARILVNQFVSWSTKKRNWWRFSDLKDQAKRMLRQAQGVLGALVAMVVMGLFLWFKSRHKFITGIYGDCGRHHGCGHATDVV